MKLSSKLLFTLLLVLMLTISKYNISMSEPFPKGTAEESPDDLDSADVIPPLCRCAAPSSNELVYFSSDMEGNSSLGFTNGSNWSWIDTISNPTTGCVPTDKYYGLSASHCFFFGNNTDGEVYDGTQPLIPSEADLVTPTIILTSAVNPLLTFEHWYQGFFWSPDLYDWGNIRVKYVHNGTEKLIEPIGGYPYYDQSGETGYAVNNENSSSGIGWINASFDLTNYTGFEIKLIFRFSACNVIGGAHGTGGWYIDDIKVNETADVFPPEIQALDSSITFDEGSLGYEASWNVSDDSPYWYNITRDDVLIDNGSWTTGWINISLDGLSAGVYEYKVSANDTLGNLATNSVSVTVRDVVIPSIIGLTTIEILEEDVISTIIRWNATDNHPYYYNITVDGQIEVENSWDGSNVTYSLSLMDPLQPGTYSFLVTVEDISGNVNQSTTIVHVIDSTPQIVNPSDLTISEGSIANITWEVSDDTPQSYNITLNGEFLSENLWTGEDINVSIEDLSLGEYNVTLRIYDTNGFNQSNVVKVTVVDGTLPVIVGSTLLIYYEETSEGNVLSWNITDAHPTVYTISINESQIQSDDWVSGENITVNVDNLVYGHYVLVLTVYDIGENERCFEVEIFVTDNQKPIFTVPGNLTCFAGKGLHSVTWYTFDLNPAILYLYRNDHLILDKNWEIRNESINIIISSLPAGTFTYRFEAIDRAGNSQFSTFVITILPYDDDSPVITGEIKISLNDSNLIELIWEVSDETPLRYEIYVNSSLIINQTWDGSSIHLNRSFIHGTHNVTVRLFDSFNNTNSFQTIVCVDLQETTTPTTSINPTSSTDVPPTTTDTPSDSPSFSMITVIFSLVFVGILFGKRKLGRK